MEYIGKFEFWFVMFTIIIAPLICFLLFYTIHYYDILPKYIVNKNCVFLMLISNRRSKLRYYKIFKNIKDIEDYLISLNEEYINNRIYSDLSGFKVEKYDLQSLHEHFENNTEIRISNKHNIFTIFKEKLT